jgi:hypothetical protein
MSPDKAPRQRMNAGYYTTSYYFFRTIHETVDRASRYVQKCPFTRSHNHNALETSTVRQGTLNAQCRIAPRSGN